MWDRCFVYLLSRSSALFWDVYREIKIIQISSCFNFSVHFHLFIIIVSAKIVWFYILIWISLVKVQFSLTFQFHWSHPGAKFHKLVHSSSDFCWLREVIQPLEICGYFWAGQKYHPLQNIFWSDIIHVSFL